MYDTIFVLFYASASLAPGKVEVRVTSPAGDCLGETFFEFLDETLDTLKRLEDDADLQRLFLTFWTQHNESLPGLSNVATPRVLFDVLF